MAKKIVTSYDSIDVNGGLTSDGNLDTVNQRIELEFWFDDFSAIDDYEIVNNSTGFMTYQVIDAGTNNLVRISLSFLKNTIEQDRTATLTINAGRDSKTVSFIQHKASVGQISPSVEVYGKDTLYNLSWDDDNGIVKVVYSTSGISQPINEQYTDTIFEYKSYDTYWIKKNTGMYRAGKITLSSTDDNGNKIYAYIFASQLGYSVIGVWEDYYYYGSNSSNYFDYNIKLRQARSTDYDTIYNGRTYIIADDTTFQINPNRIVENYLFLKEYPFNNKITQEKDALREVSIGYNSNDSAITVFNYYALNNWSYDLKDAANFKYNEYVVFSKPIVKIYDTRQYLIFTSFWCETKGKLDVNIHTDDEIIDTITFSASTSDKTTQIVPITYCNKIDKEGDIYIDFEQIGTVKKTCYNYCLYYINKYGGWDSLLVMGNALKSDNIARDKYQRFVKNTSNRHSSIVYNTTITPKWTLYTGIMNDEQCSLMDNLFESNTVYLHNLETDDIIPVNITNTSFDYKTRKNQGLQVKTYTINVEEAQSKRRR